LNRTAPSFDEQGNGEVPGLTGVPVGPIRPRLHLALLQARRRLGLAIDSQAAKLNPNRRLGGRASAQTRDTRPSFTREKNLTTPKTKTSTTEKTKLKDDRSERACVGPVGFIGR